MDTFVILYPLTIQKLQNNFFCSEFIFYNSFKIDLAYDDIVPKVIEEEETILETVTNTLNSSNINSFFLEKKKKFIAANYKLNIEQNIEFVIEVLTNNENNLVREEEIQSESIEKNALDLCYLTNDLDLNKLISNEDEDILEKKQVYSKNLILDYNLDLDFGRAYAPPTVRLHEQEGIFKIDIFLHF